MTELNKQVEMARQKANNIQVQYNNLSTALEKVQREKTEVSVGLKAQLASVEEELTRYKNEEEDRKNRILRAEKALVDSALYKEAKACIESETKLPNNKMYELQQSLMEIYSECALALINVYAIKEDKLQSCLLLKAHFSLSEIATLQGRPFQTVRMSFYRLSKKIWPQDGSTEKLIDLIRSL